MNDNEKYILDTIKTCVWSGFYDADEVHEVINDNLDDDSDEQMLRSAVDTEFQKKGMAEASWPEDTDCDRLDRAFEALDSNGIIALQNAGYTMSDGIDDVSEELSERDETSIKGYCFYHGQDLERAVAGEGLMLAFGDFNDDATAKTEVATLIRNIVESNGFTTEWNGDPESRINIPNIDWKRKTSR